ncbi:MAG: MarR family transcriptional regulator [Kibdelosporangium sp.]
MNFKSRGAMAGDAGLAAALVNLSHQVLHLFTEVGRGYDLTQQQAELLCAVIVRGRVGMTELAKVMHMEKSSLSNLVERAEQRGLAVRTRDAGDRRVTWVQLTDEGTRLAMQTHSDVTARLDRLVERLSVRDQQRLTEVVEQITTAEPL